jgi:hypothetical protein
MPPARLSRRLAESTAVSETNFQPPQVGATPQNPVAAITRRGSVFLFSKQAVANKAPFVAAGP